MRCHRRGNFSVGIGQVGCRRFRGFFTRGRLRSNKIRKKWRKEGGVLEGWREGEECGAERMVNGCYLKCF